MSRKRTWIAAILAGLAAWATVASHPLRAQTRPNFVVIMADDLDVQTFDAAVAGGLMPNVKTHLIDKGLSFTNSFVTSTQAAPNRASFLTGQYPHNHNVRGSFPPNGGVTALNQNSTIGTWLKNSGYVTGYVGRYVFGYGLWTSPTVVPPGWTMWAATVDPTTYDTDGYRFNYQGILIDASQLAAYFGNPIHQTDANVIFTAGFFSLVNASTPFFLTVNPYTPNYEVPIVNECPIPGDPSFWGGNIWGVTTRSPARHLNTVYGNTLSFALPQNPSFNEVDVADKPDWLRLNPLMTATDIDCLQKAHWRRLESLRSLDDLVGQVITRLQSTGTLANTYVMFTSDNGFVTGQHRLTQKGSPHELAIKVPLIIRIPGSTAKVTIPGLVTNNDLAPTIAHLAGVTPTITVDGRTMAPLISNPAATNWRKMILVEHFEQVEIDGFSYPPPYAALRSTLPARMFARYPPAPGGTTAELYDLALDPFELQNVVAEPSRATEVAYMDLWRAAMQTCSGVTCRILEQIFALP